MFLLGHKSFLSRHYNYLPEAIPLYPVTVVSLENVIYLHSKLFGHFQRKVMVNTIQCMYSTKWYVCVCVCLLYILSANALDN